MSCIVPKLWDFLTDFEPISTIWYLSCYRTYKVPSSNTVAHAGPFVSSAICNTCFIEAEHHIIAPCPAIVREFWFPVSQQDIQIRETPPLLVLRHHTRCLEVYSIVAKTQRSSYLSFEWIADWMYLNSRAFNQTPKGIHRRIVRRQNKMSIILTRRIYLAANEIVRFHR